jgi:hypothetical protein
MSGNKDRRDADLKREMSAKFDKLNEVWNKAEQRIGKQIANVAAFVVVETYNGGAQQWCRCMGYAKYRGRWRICQWHQPAAGVELYDEDDDENNDFGMDNIEMVPVVDLSAAERIELVKHYNRLCDAVQARAKAMLPKIDAAAADLEKLL